MDQIPAKKTSTLAIVGLVLCLVGFVMVCIPLVGPCLAILLWTAGFVLGIVALVQVNKDPSLGGMGLAIAAIAIPPTLVIAVAVIGSLSALAIPSFIKFQAHSKQSECNSNLKALYTAERSFFQSEDQYSPKLEEIGFSPERGNRYAYFLDTRGELQDRSSLRLGASPNATGVGVDTYKYTAARSISVTDLPRLAGGVSVGLNGQCPYCSFVVACAGNVDNEESVLDVWSISTADREGPNGTSIPAGVPYNDLNDVTND